MCTFQPGKFTGWCSEGVNIKNHAISLFQRLVGWVNIKNHPISLFQRLVGWVNIKNHPISLFQRFVDFEVILTS